MTRRALALLICVFAAVAQGGVGIVRHLAFRTNAFDLSVFDYALWTTATFGRLGYVPMFGYSLFAQHFMPTLLILSPLAAFFTTPVYLIVVQTLLYVGAAYVLFELARRCTTDSIAFALMIAFLFSRRSYSAVTSYFYIESAVPVLVFGFILALWSSRYAWYWVLLVLALGCKEDMAIYVGAYGIFLVSTNRRRIGAATIAVAGFSLAVSLTVAIPHFRSIYSLPGSNHFVEGRYGVSSLAGTLSLLPRILSISAMGRVATVLSATAFTSLLAPSWFAIVVPGLLLNLAAMPGTGQAGLSGHYLWPILPWLFVSAAVGTGRLVERHRRWCPLLIVMIACIDAPLPGALVRAEWRTPATAKTAAAQLREISTSATITAQPNLIPHLPRRIDMRSLGAYEPREIATDYVLMTTIGDLWPLDPAVIELRSRALVTGGRYEQISDRPVIIFRNVRNLRRAAPAPSAADTAR